MFASSSAADGSLLIAIPIAIAAGTVSFLSPCILPLVPGYLAYVTGLAGASVVTAGPSPQVATRRMLAGALGFILGFSLVFVSFGALFGAFGLALRGHAMGLTRIFGVITILLGLSFMGALPAVPALSRDYRIHRLPPVGLIGAPLLGGAFALGWTPCIGPTLATVLNLAASSENTTAGRGAFLTLCYCLGLGLPFILVGLLLDRSAQSLQWLKRHSVRVSQVGGVFLVLIGIMQVTGSWFWLVEWIQIHIDPPNLPL